MGAMAEHFSELVKERVCSYRRAGEMFPSVARDYVALGGLLKAVTCSLAAPAFRTRPTVRSFADAASLQSVQVFGALPLMDKAFLGVRPETEKMKASRTAQEGVMTVELQDFSARYVRFLMTTNYAIQGQCERQIQGCVVLLEQFENITHYAPLRVLCDSFADISMQVMVTQLSLMPNRPPSSIVVQRPGQGGDHPHVTQTQSASDSDSDDDMGE